MDAHSNLNWNDLRFFLALQRDGRLITAARRLRVDHTTVARRIATLEEALGARLFEKSPAGHMLTDAGRALVPYAEAVEAQYSAMMMQVAGKDTALSGTVRVMAPDVFGSRLIMPSLADFREQHGDIRVEVVEETRHGALSRREADLALTFSRPEVGRLVARKLGEFCLRLYASPEYLERRGMPETAEDLSVYHDFIWFVDDLLNIEEIRRIEKQSKDINVVMRCTSMAGQAHAAATGGGLAYLPCFYADRLPGLVRVLPDSQVSTRELWLVGHEDTRRVARISALSGFLEKLVRSCRAELIGQA